MYTLVSKYTYINAGPKQAILKFKIIRENYKFKVIFELYELHIKYNEVEICKLVEEQCKQINSQVLEKFNNDLKGSIILDYYDVESYLPILRNMILKLQDNDQKYNVILYDKLQVILSRKELIRIYNDLESFYKNYILLETCLKLITKDEIQDEKPEVVKVCNYKKQEQENQIDQPKQKDNSNLLFQLCIDNKLQQLLIHQILNYYLFLPQDQIQIKENTIYLPSLFSSVLFNSQYNCSLLFSLSKKVEISDIKLIILKILKNLKNNDQLDSIFIIGLSFLLYFYILRLVYETHTAYVLENINEIFCNNMLQEKILNSQIQIYFKDIDLQFKVFNIKLDDILETQIEELSKKYDYLKAVDQEDFLDKIFNDCNKNNNKEHPICQYEIFDLVDSQKINLNSIEIFNNNDMSNNGNQLLNYTKDSDGKIETYCLKIFNLFLEDPDKFYLLKKKNNISLSTTVLNLFPIVSEILKNIKNVDRLDDTLTYYNLLIDKVSDNFLPTTLLYIIFQLILPYMYNNYNIHSFNNCF